MKKILRKSASAIIAPSWRIADKIASMGAFLLRNFPIVRVGEWGAAARQKTFFDRMPVFWRDGFDRG
jgi:hypothetical protein